MIASDCIHRAASPRCRVGSPPKQVGDPGQAPRLVTEDALQHLGRASFPSVEDGLLAGDLPSHPDCRHNHLRVEASERGSDDLPNHLTHTRTPTGEVGLQLRTGDAIRGDRTPTESQRLVRPVRLRGEVPQPLQALQHCEVAAPSR